MLKRLASLFAALVLAFAVGCSTVPSTDPNANPQQAAITATTTSYQALDQAILAATAAVKSGALKPDDARKAMAAFQTAKTGLDAALVSLRASQAASAPK
jgi:ABC-type Zn uptake system ZnuABC Zn-binding protein ZnuA